MGVLHVILMFVWPAALALSGAGVIGKLLPGEGSRSQEQQRGTASGLARGINSDALMGAHPLTLSDVRKLETNEQFNTFGRKLDSGLSERYNPMSDSEKSSGQKKYADIKVFGKKYKNNVLQHGTSSFPRGSEGKVLQDITQRVRQMGMASNSIADKSTLHPVTPTKSRAYHKSGSVEPAPVYGFERKEIKSTEDVDVDSRVPDIPGMGTLGTEKQGSDAHDRDPEVNITSTNIVADYGLINRDSPLSEGAIHGGRSEPFYKPVIDPSNHHKVAHDNVDLIQKEMSATQDIDQRVGQMEGSSNLRLRREASTKRTGSLGSSNEDLGDTLSEDYLTSDSGGGLGGQNWNSPSLRKDHGLNRIRHSGHFETSRFHSSRKPQMSHAASLPILQRSTRAHSDTEQSGNFSSSQAKNSTLDSHKIPADTAENAGATGDAIPKLVSQSEEDNNSSKAQNLTDSKSILRTQMFVDYRASAVVDPRPGSRRNSKVGGGVGELSVNPNEDDQPFHVAGVSDDPVPESEKTVIFPGMEQVNEEDEEEEEVKVKEVEEVEEGEKEPEPEAEEIIPADINPAPTPSGETEILVWPNADPDFTDMEGDIEEVKPEDTDMEPKSSPIFDLNGKPEPEEESELDSKILPGLENQANAEPEPDWPEAKKAWGAAWELHVYGIGIAHAVLAVYSIISIIRLWRKKNLLSQHYFIVLNSIMLVMGFTRAVYFLVDGYNSLGRFTPAGAYFLYSLSFPCLTSAFSILLLALVQTTRMKFLSPKIQQVRILVGIIAFHFSFSILTDIVVGYVVSAEAMMFVCQIFTVVWGLLLFGGYVYIFRRLYMAARRRQKEMLRLTLSRMKLNGSGHPSKPPKLTLNLAVKVTLLSAIIGLILAVWQTYGMVGVFGVFSEKIPDPWAWWWFKFGMRLLELALCITMCYVATQPFRYQGVETEKQCRWMNIFFMAPCQRLFECNTSIHDEDLHWNDMHEMSPDSSHENMLTNGGQAFTDPDEAYPINGSTLPSPNATPNGHLNAQRGTGSRPASLLVNDSGFVRFRQDGEMEGSPVLLSTDDEPEGSDPSGYTNPFMDQTEGAAGSKDMVLPNTFGESSTDPEDMYFHYYPCYTTLPQHIRQYPLISGHNTGTTTPATPRSFASTELDNYAGSMFSFRPPSSIHLRESIDNVLNIHGFSIRTPDNLDSPTNTPFSYLSRGSRAPSLRSHRIHSSMGDLDSIVSARSRNTWKYGQCGPHESMKSIESATTDSYSRYEDALSDTGTFHWERPYLFRSHSDCTGSILASWDRHLDEQEDRTNLQDLLLDINKMCVALGQFSQNRRESVEGNESDSEIHL